MKILVVDDMASWREFHKTALKEIYIEQDYQIDTADCARDALDKLYENTSAPYDLIITDLQMEEDFRPRYAGEWLIEQIKNLPAYKNTRIVISSGTYNIKAIAEGLGVDYIPKRIACTDMGKYEGTIKG